MDGELNFHVKDPGIKTQAAQIRKKAYLPSEINEQGVCDRAKLL